MAKRRTIEVTHPEAITDDGMALHLSAIPASDAPDPATNEPVPVPADVQVEARYRDPVSGHVVSTAFGARGALSPEDFAAVLRAGEILVAAAMKRLA